MKKIFFLICFLLNYLSILAQENKVIAQDVPTIAACKDTFWLEFNKKLPYLTSKEGDVVELFSYYVGDSNKMNQWYKIKSDSWLNKDSSRIYITPKQNLSYNRTSHPLPDMNRYRLVVTDRLPRNSAATKWLYSKEFWVSSIVRIGMVILNENGDTLRRDKNGSGTKYTETYTEKIIERGGRINIKDLFLGNLERWIDDCRFLYWKAPGLPELDKQIIPQPGGLSGINLKVKEGCFRESWPAPDYTITAVYSKPVKRGVVVVQFDTNVRSEHVGVQSHISDVPQGNNHFTDNNELRLDTVTRTIKWSMIQDSANMMWISFYIKNPIPTLEPNPLYHFGTLKIKSNIAEYNISDPRNSSSIRLILVLKPGQDSVWLYCYDSFKPKVSVDLSGDTQNTDRVSIYPNPVTGGDLTIGLSGYKSEEKVMIELYNSIGKLVKNYQLVYTNKMFISTQELSSGTYTVIVKQNDKIASKVFQVIR